MSVNKKDMFRNKVCYFCITIVLLLFSCSKNYDVYKDPNANIEDRIEDLLSKMTIEEKIWQLNQLILGENTNTNNIGIEIKEIPPEIGSLISSTTDTEVRNAMQKRAIEESRLGIPILFGMDVIHGYRTIFPIPLAQACSFNPELTMHASQIAAKEAKQSGVDWSFSPMVDIAKDPRWGRVAEGYGEDPYLASIFGSNVIKGYQGESLNDTFSIAACLKHYVAYGASEGGRDYHATEVSRNSLWNVYLRPFHTGVITGCATVMSAFNDISGIPASANHYTLTEILKQQWGHKGFVVSDWNSIEQLIFQGAANNRKHATELALNAGVDMDMKDLCYKDHISELLKEGKISRKRLDDAVRRVLRIKFALGLFEKPYTQIIPDSLRYLTDEYRQQAKDVAIESMVLLKNDNELLPLKANKVALIGPMADDSINIMGSWSCHGMASDVVTIKTGLRSSGLFNIEYSKGSGIDEPIKNGLADACRIAEKCDVVILCLGEYAWWSGENGSKSSISLPDVQKELLKGLAQTGKPIVLLLSSGRPLELHDIEPYANSILQIWQPGTMTGHAVCDILTGVVSPSGKLAMTFPYSTGQIPIYYNSRRQARFPYQNQGQGKYKDIPNEPMYPFGYGLSYTNFEYGKLMLSDTVAKIGDKLKISINISNIGKRDAKETCLWYISDPVSSITRPTKELKYFEKKVIRHGEKEVFDFELDTYRDLGYYTDNGDYIVEPGRYYVIVGKDSVEFNIK